MRVQTPWLLSTYCRYIFWLESVVDFVLNGACAVAVIEDDANIGVIVIEVAAAILIEGAYQNP